MVGKEQLYQAITFAVVVIFFDILELRRPGYGVNRGYRLPLNVAALIIVIGAGEFWKVLIRSGLGSLPAGSLFSFLYTGQVPGLVKILLGIVLADLTLYWIHRYMHRPRLRRTHRFHHSIEELWWLSGSRTSVMHLLLFALPQTLISYSLLGLTPSEAGIGASVGVIVNVWLHTNISATLGPVDRIFVTPSFHRIHHGAKGLGNRNLGFVLTLWDRIFGTYIDPNSLGEDFTLGYVSTRKRLVRMILGL